MTRGAGGAAKGMRAARERILELCDADTRVIPGHGALARAADVRRTHAMLSEIVERIESAIAAGQSLDQILAAKPTAEWDEAHAAGFITPENLVRLIHASLAP